MLLKQEDFILVVRRRHTSKRRWLRSAVRAACGAMFVCVPKILLFPRVSSLCPFPSPDDAAVCEVCVTPIELRCLPECAMCGGAHALMMTTGER